MKEKQPQCPLSYVNYSFRPVVLDAEEAVDSGVIRYAGRKILYIPDESTAQHLGKSKIKIGPERQYNLIEATLFGLNDALETRSRLREKFDKEMEKLSNLKGKYRSYGHYVFYPGNGDLVQTAPKFFHRLALVASTSSLYLDPERKMGWEEVRGIFDKLVVAVAGASVGNNILQSIVMDIRPEKIKIGDPNFFKVPNANRVRLSYRDIVLSNEQKSTTLGLKNKAIGAALQIHETDPFMDIWAYRDGVNGGNANTFVMGVKGEPPADFVVEETDNPDAKVLIREAARKGRKRLGMASDLGSTIQVDIRPFDQDTNATLAYGISDEDLYQKQETARRNPGDRRAFFEFVEALIGDDFKKCGEFGDFVAGRFEHFFTGLPQKGSTAAMAGAILAEVVARTALGYKFPERFIFDKQTLKIKKYGELV